MQIETTASKNINGEKAEASHTSYFLSSGPTYSTGRGQGDWGSGGEGKGGEGKGRRKGKGWRGEGEERERGRRGWRVKAGAG